MKRFLSNRLLLVVVSLIVGALVVLAIRFATYNPHHTHYHANFAVYTACQTGDAPILPEQRAHMHDNVNSVVHVHDDGVTWGDFFTNLGWYVGPDFVQTRDGTLYKAAGAKQLHILINGTDFTGGAAISRQIINDKDRLLVSFGDVSQSQLTSEFKAVPATAAQVDKSVDPASLSALP
jgi:hypothetical protein